MDGRKLPSERDAKGGIVFENFCAGEGHKTQILREVKRSKIGFEVLTRHIAKCKCFLLFSNVLQISTLLVHFNRNYLLYL